MSERFIRTELIYGKKAMEKLASSRVAVFGAGGVGGYVIEALARSGIGAIDIIDNDVESVSNINRQILALDETVGQFKTQVAKKRVESINPECKVTTYEMFFLPENSCDIDFSLFDYVADAIDTVAGKVEIIGKAQTAGVPVISSMGAGNKVNPSLFRVVDISKTENDPLAKAVRVGCRKKGINHFKVVWSPETAIKPGETERVSTDTPPGKRATPGSTAFTPPVAGLIMASEIINDLVK